jgi:hypothetical protein
MGQIGRVRPDGGVEFLENRLQGDLLALFLGVAAALASWRAGSAQPVAGVAAAALGGVVAAVWLVWRLKPAGVLIISRESVTLRRGEKVITQGMRDPDSWIRITVGRGGFLSVEGPRPAVFHLGTFPYAKALASACRDAGWELRREQYRAAGTSHEG